MGTLELSYIALDVEKQFMCRHVGNTFHKHFIYYQSCLFMNRRIIYLQTWHQFTVKFSKDLCYTVHYFVTKIYHPYILKIFRYSEKNNLLVLTDIEETTSSSHRISSYFLNVLFICLYIFYKKNDFLMVAICQRIRIAN